MIEFLGSWWGLLAMFLVSTAYYIVKHERRRGCGCVHNLRCPKHGEEDTDQSA